MKIIDVVRDPRGIYSSWLTTEPFATLVKNNEFYSIKSVCDSLAANIDFDHSRVFHLVFEELVKSPHKVMKDAYDFMGMTFGMKQLAWIKDTFDATECPEPKPWEIGFTDCHTNSEDVTDRWRDVLSPSDLDAFKTTPSCKRVLAHYGYTW